MPGFLYFKPAHMSAVTPADLAAWGLEYAFTGSLGGSVCIRNTPSGGPGQIFADAERMGGLAIAMAMGEQVWRKLPGQDLYVGYWRDHKPGPQDLARPQRIDGYEVQLADGHSWLIPLVRRFDVPTLSTVSQLPCYMELGEDGKWHRGQVLAVHAHLWNVTEPVANALLGEYVEEESREISDEAIFAAVVALLGANYVVGPAELSLIQALTNEARTHAAVMAACDWLTFMQWSDLQKKSASPRAAAGLTTSVGEMD